MTCKIQLKMSSVRFISKFSRFLVQNEKKNIFAISDFPNLQYARKLQSFLPRCIKELSGKSSRNNIVPAIFLYKAVIKRECGIHCFKGGFE